MPPDFSRAFTDRLAASMRDAWLGRRTDNWDDQEPRAKENWRMAARTAQRMVSEELAERTGDFNTKEQVNG